MKPYSAQVTDEPVEHEEPDQANRSASPGKTSRKRFLFGSIGAAAIAASGVAWKTTSSSLPDEFRTSQGVLMIRLPNADQKHPSSYVAETECSVADYREFLLETNRIDSRLIEYENSDKREMPATVNWIEAKAFCAWLTQRDHKLGKLPAKLFYTLPSDWEWGKAANLAIEEDYSLSPKARSEKAKSAVYLWGTTDANMPTTVNGKHKLDFTPEAPAGFAGCDGSAAACKVRHNDKTGRFIGLIGNVSELIEDVFDGNPYDPNSLRCIRGANFETAIAADCLAGARVGVSADLSGDSAKWKPLVGFRLAARAVEEVPKKP